MDELLKHTNALISSGIAIMPVRKNKAPLLDGWTDPDFTLTHDQMKYYFERGYQLGIITGKRSNITVIDIDFEDDGVFGTDPSIFPDTYTVRTPSGALQKYYQYEPRIQQSQKHLADFPCVDIRNDGGQVVAVPSVAVYTKTYKNGRTRDINAQYVVSSGSITNLAPFPSEMFAKYLRDKNVPTIEMKKHEFRSDRPGDDFEQSVSWADILTPLGYIAGHTDKNGSLHWTRPNKKGAVTSATTRKTQDGRERLFVFSTNCTPFETYDESQHNSYTKLSAYALVHHGGNFMDAVKALRKQGYGVQPSQEQSEDAPISSKIDAETANREEWMDMTCLNDIDEKPIDWVWRGKIARGELCIFAGEPGAGKTMIVADLAARITTGNTVPFSSEKMCEGSVVFLTSENDPAKVLRPRLVAAGADLKRVHLLSSSVGKIVKGKKTTRHVALSEDAQKIGEAVASRDDVVALVIDPISEYMGNKDANNNSDVRDVLATLTDNVRDKNIAIIAVTHFNKKVEITNASSRINGSIGFAGAARTAFAVGKYYDDDWDDEEKVARKGQMGFSSVKNNLSGDKGGYVYKISPVSYESNGTIIETARVEWVEEIEDSADDLLARTTTRKGRKATARSQCSEWLERELRKHPNGITRQEVIEIGAQEGFSRATIDRASNEIVIIRDGGMWKIAPIVF